MTYPRDLLLISIFTKSYKIFIDINQNISILEYINIVSMSL